MVAAQLVAVDRSRPTRRRTVPVAGALAVLVAVTFAPSPPSATAASWSYLPAGLRHVGPATQLLVVTSPSWASTRAQLRGYEKRDGRWRLVIGPVAARVGYSGMKPAYRRVQGDGTTPAGTFTLTSAFGVRPDPGTRLPYWHIVSRDQWWVGDRHSRHYNDPRWGRLGGFRVTTHGIDGSERLIDYPVQYAHAAVIDFNRPRTIAGRGSGIFLHVNGRGATAGCVSVRSADVVRILRWLDPARQPRITIAPAPVVTAY
jgi:L,D-peptidoglycan transpeptidase YkuD (ErfK/YbiS/YcfS/YnhG family)